MVLGANLFLHVQRELYLTDITIQMPRKITSVVAISAGGHVGEVPEGFDKM
jgi:hypothetical protein